MHVTSENEFYLHPSEQFGETSLAFSELKYEGKTLRIAVEHGATSSLSSV